MTVTIENTNVDTALNIAELTTASLTGTGVFDVLLQTLRLHLDREFTSGRITGTAYATVYSQAITSFLQQAVGFCLSKTKLALELQQMQEQVVLLQKQQDQITATIRQTDYITDYQLPADLATKNKQLALLDYDLVNIKPAELAIAQQDVLLKTAQAALTSYDLTTIKPQELALLTQKVANETYIVQHRLPAEVAGIQAETSLKAYELSNVQPAQVAQIVAQTSHVTKQELSTIQQTANLVTEQANMVKQGALVDSQKIVADNQALSITAETDLKVYELTDIKPTQKAQIVAETSHVTKQELNTVQQTLNLGSQQAQIETETDRILYEITNKLPEEVQLIKLNQDQLIAQNNKIATDTVVTIKQGHLTDAQTCQVTAQTNQVNAEVALKLPEEVELVKRNQTMLTTQIAQVNAETTLKLPAEINQLEAQIALLEFDLATVKPVEVVNLTKQGALVDSQTAQTTAQTSQVTYTTANLIPAQVALTTAQADSADAQTALYAQKTTTELAQTTATPASGSVMGVQNLLMNRQADNYLRDAEQKAAKLMLETWNVRFSTESTSTNHDTVNHLSDGDIGVAVNKLITGIGGTVTP